MRDLRSVELECEEDAVFKICGVWESQYVGIGVYRNCGVWESGCAEVALCVICYLMVLPRDLSYAMKNAV